MNIGPIQLIAIGFERTDKFKGQIMQELETRFDAQLGDYVGNLGDPFGFIAEY